MSLARQSAVIVHGDSIVESERTVRRLNDTVPNIQLRDIFTAPLGGSERHCDEAHRKSPAQERQSKATLYSAI